MHHCQCLCVSRQAAIPSFPLSLAGEGEQVRVMRLPQGSRVQERLLSMGICVNDEITVIKKQPGGALMIEKNGARYALGGGMGHKIQVAKL